MSAPSTHSVCVIGCGRWFRGDDQVGLLAAERLNLRGMIEGDILVTESPGTDIVASCGGIELLIIIDGALPDDRHAPGSWQRLDYLKSPERLHMRDWTSSHSLSVDLALQMAANLGELPDTVWVYAVAIRRGGYGEKLSPMVESALEPLCAAIADDVRHWRTQRHHEASASTTNGRTRQEADHA